MGGGAGTTTAGAVYNYLLSKGMSENHAKGITVNISRESGFQLGAHGDKGIGGSFGLFQWNMAAGRGGPMMAAVPDWETNWKGQIDYALQEHRGPEYLRTQFATAGDAAFWWMDKWEIPAARIVAQYSPAVYEGMINRWDSIVVCLLLHLRQLLLTRQQHHRHQRRRLQATDRWGVVLPREDKKQQHQRQQHNHQ